MIALALAFQLAAASGPVVAPGVLSVRVGKASADIPTVQRDGIAAVPVHLLAPVLPARDTVTPGGRRIVRIADFTCEFADGVPFVRANGVVYPLAVAPRERDGVMVVPYEVFAELLPRLAPARWAYDADRRELTMIVDPDKTPLVATSGAPRSGTASRASGRVRRRRVVVDAGHGGPDYGMRGPIGAHWQIHEKDITLQVAKKLAAALRARGVDVIMTRTTDTLIALSDRGKIANEQHGDVFVSVHVNAAPLEWRDAKETRGYETYFLAEAKTEDARRVERMENASIHFETGASSKQGDAMTYIINDMAQNEHLRESSELAALVQQELGGASPGPSRGVFQAGFRVLVTAYMPAVLVEIGFGTNADEAKMLINPSQQKKIAGSIADATIEYLDRYEQRLRGASANGAQPGDRPSSVPVPPRR